MVYRYVCNGFLRQIRLESYQPALPVPRILVLCNHLQNVVATTYIFRLQLSTFIFYNKHFLRFMNNIQSYQHIGKAKNYLYVIAGNLCKNHVKKWKADCVEKEVLERKLISDGGIPKQEKQIYVKQALEQMNPELKEIIIMFYFQDFKLKEIADILQIGLPLVKYRHKRAKEELKRLLGEEDSHEPGKDDGNI